MLPAVPPRRSTEAKCGAAGALVTTKAVVTSAQRARRLQATYLRTVILLWILATASAAFPAFIAVNLQSPGRNARTRQPITLPFFLVRITVQIFDVVDFHVRNSPCALAIGRANDPRRFKVFAIDARRVCATFAVGVGLVALTLGAVPPLFVAPRWGVAMGPDPAGPNRAKVVAWRVRM